MKQLKLSQGKYAIVDDEDYPLLSRFAWKYQKSKPKNGRLGSISVSREFYRRYEKYFITLENSIICRKVGCHNNIIWKNGNRLDFRKENLTTTPFGRAGTTEKATKHPFCISKYKGVSQYKDTGIWRGQIERGKRKTPEYIWKAKTFKTEKEAAIWYNEKAKELFGENAYQNKI